MSCRRDRAQQDRLVDALTRRRLANRFPGAPQVSARDRRGAGRAAGAIAERFAERFEPVRLLIPYDAGDKLAELYELGAPIDERDDLAEGVFVRARLPRRELGGSRRTSSPRQRRARRGRA